MKIILPTSNEIHRYTGPGGYQAAMSKIDINKNVDVFGFYDIAIPPHSVSKEHYHNEFIELFYFLTPMRIKINDEEHNLPTGTVVVLHPGDRHEEYANETAVHYLAMKFPYVENDKVITNE
ncbi:hypothetical protein A2851_01195 [Candidatus Kaiserbacteria bacterium RIFCSPHIGHO2_01_FULL_53_29]|uniref:AraC-type arabinose-binding/dimerisation domain-containing protein n=1 Tax=Candidatus Kaiserbacteria bacterium RIFCSPHIGHO2_01_FULL_53_29 TaxID=1798480 RepID=A0A1F6CYL1_9BACT|nr:MAG: hypothetical protein A2851_01195 [Candidatus Kaiserbacteria bacterium RIFCSPHIGHO2_01_FULL_53_29]